MADAETPAARPPWTPPIWLRNLKAVAAEQRAMLRTPTTPAERLDLALELSAFTLARLREQAERRGCTLSALLIMYEQASNRLRARG